ncbi:transposase [Clostridium tetanomorphum]|uniref:transposase n=1 Tax=Clostridium tetanomorphum TaxID=1553 RepID=UPI00044E8E4F|nr:transposase [Clostridium tetanomorphum DSM 665]MBP1862823.1 transposase [Clostridium tetanomorphum]NRS86961.1 transposase [Clostridium tetanomorphum]NRZ99255.1 transposase [Clostridium tetanomorphum]SQC00236.1 transposase IS3/IS911 family protein [Clostridium tetanomorphum]
MARGQKQYTEEFKNTIVELYNSGKSLAELSSEYAVSKSTIIGWIKKNAKLEEEIEILKKAMGIFARK